MDAPHRSPVGSPPAPEVGPALEWLRECLRALPWLCLLPLLLLGPSLLPGRSFLPIAPAAFAPLAAEDPAAAARALDGANYSAIDALFPMASDAIEMHRAVRAGELPLWDPKLGMGSPLFAQSMFGALYPPHALAFVFDPLASLGWIALIDLLCAGVGLYLFTRGRGIDHGPALIGAALFQTAGFATANLHDLMKVEAALWLPWCLWAIDGGIARRRGASLVLAAGLALSWLAGFAPIALFCTLAAAAYAGIAVLRAAAGPAVAGRLLLAGVAGLCLAAPQWVATISAWEESSRPERTEVVADAVPWAANLMWVAPEVFGRADEPIFAPHHAAAWWLARPSEREICANANLLEWNGFVGVLGLALAVAAALSKPRRSVVATLFVVVPMGFAQGWPGMSWLRDLPGLDLGSPARGMAVAWVGWAWLAAIGAQACVERAARARWSVALALGCAALGVGLHFAGDANAWTAELPDRLAARFGVERATVDALLSPEELARAADRVRDSGQWLTGFALLAALALCAARFGPARGAWCVLFLCLGAENAWYARAHLMPRIDAGWPSSPAMEALAAAVGDGRLLRLDVSESGVGEVLELARPNLPQVYGIADLTPYVALTPRRPVELWSRVDRRAGYRGGISRICDPTALDHPALDVLRVTAILATHRIDHPRLEVAYATERFVVHRRKGVPPRARLIQQAVATPPAGGAVEWIAAGQADPATQTVLPPGTRSPPLGGGVSAGQVEFLENRRNRVALRARSADAAWLVLADGYDPGWRALVDGLPATVVAVDHCLRGVYLAAGEHRVEFEYAPGSLRLGGAMALAGLAFALLGWRLERRTRIS